jgi:hypothetical protein
MIPGLMFVATEHTLFDTSHRNVVHLALPLNRPLDSACAVIDRADHYMIVLIDASAL